MLGGDSSVLCGAYYNKIFSDNLTNWTPKKGFVQIAKPNKNLGVPSEPSPTKGRYSDPSNPSLSPYHNPNPSTEFTLKQPPTGEVIWAEQMCAMYTKIETLREASVC